MASALPHIAKEECFALKGGTAINLFVRDMPRLSIDIDLQYINFDEREAAFANINNALNKIGIKAIIRKDRDGLCKIICSDTTASVCLKEEAVFVR